MNAHWANGFIPVRAHCTFTAILTDEEAPPGPLAFTATVYVPAIVPGMDALPDPPPHARHGQAIAMTSSMGSRFLLRLPKPKAITRRHAKIAPVEPAGVEWSAAAPRAICAVVEIETTKFTGLALGRF